MSARRWPRRLAVALGVVVALVAELRIYDELGHVPMEEDGARTVADVAPFLDRALHH